MTTRRVWTPAEVAELVRRYPHERTVDIAADLGRHMQVVYAKAATLGLRKSAAYIAAFGHRLDGIVGASTRFRPGSTPWNKGTHYRAGGRSHETQFKPGQASARWDPEIYCVGALRITSDGCLQIKLGPGPQQWAMLSRYAWYLHSGRWPRRGYVVRARNGDPYDVRPENLELLTQRENMRRNSIHAVLPLELRRVVQLAGALRRQINRREASA